ncbi:uracil-xanthine permease family protein [Butyricicoccus sp. Marseille-Q5471]|uniref:uracil-xanthine permease family protein n=1 Tax=Butyricicoccus sp. Marseille-Q5471 TaxID=3039493 RepID=UPI0024BC263E|nr:solute carrier family 23 protein [Butyricicoccus sp. Marseille-Q5471]
MKKSQLNTTPYDFEGKLPLRQAIPLGLQHVLAMFVGNLTPILIITSTCAAMSDAEQFAALQVSLLQNAMLIAGLVTLIQLFAIGPIGGKVPIIMGTSSGFIGVFKSVADVMGGGILGYAAIMGASIIGGLFEGVLGFFLKPLRRFFPAVVTGTVVLSIGLSLIGVGVGSFGGGTAAKDYGSVENLLIALVVLIVILALKHGCKGMASHSCILIGIVFGYILCAVLALVLPTTAVAADGTEYVKAWVLNWDKVAQAKWFAIPEFMPIKPVFDARAIVPVLIMFIVTAVETVGDISGVMEGGMNREATDKELSGGVICDGLGSSFAALFGVLPNTSFSQNVGLVTLTKIVNRFALACGAIFLVLCGLLPKLAAVVSIMPQSVLGGAAVIMFSSIAISGIQLITKEPLGARNMTIVSVALGLGYGLGANSAVLSGLPQSVQLIFGGSGIVPAALVAILLNILLPKEKASA